MKNYNLNTYTFSYLYSVYSWPNVFLCFLGGFLIDRIGVKLGLIVFLAIATLGQLIFVIGTYKDLYTLMLAGRLIYGSGCESSLVALNNYAIIWFTGKELNMVFAIIMNMARIGSAMVYFASEPTYHALLNGYSENRALKNTITLLGTSILFGFLCSILTAILNPTKEKKEVKFRDSSKKEMIPIKEARFFDFISFPLIFWLLAIIISVYIALIYSFFTQAQASLTEKFMVSDNEANNYVFFSSFFGAILSTGFGMLIDYKGRNMVYATLSLFSCIIGLTLIAFTYVNPYISMFFMAVSVAGFFCSVWSPISYIIPEHQLGTAYGIVQGGINLMFSIETVAEGAIAHRFGFQMMHTFLIICTLVTMPLLVWCWVLDVRNNKVLNMSNKERDIFLNSRK